MRGASSNPAADNDVVVAYLYQMCWNDKIDI